LGYECRFHKEGKQLLLKEALNRYVTGGLRANLHTCKNIGERPVLIFKFSNSVKTSIRSIWQMLIEFGDPILGELFQVMGIFLLYKQMQNNN